MRGKNCDVPESLQLLAEGKVGRLERLARDATRAEIEFSETGHHHSPQIVECEVTIQLRRTIVRGHAQAGDASSALDLAVDKVDHQLAKIKDKRVTRLHGGRRPGPQVVTELPLDEIMQDLEDEPVGDGHTHDEIRIVREKSFDTKPMNPEEAALQMELLGHDFFLFSNSENGNAAVIYRRRDGDLGLIETVG